MRKGNKAQLVGEVFMFILAAALAALIISYGYSAIKTFLTRTEQISFINFKTKLQNEIKTTASEFGSVKRIDLAMPENYDMLCLIDRSKSSDDSCICYNAKCNTNIEEYNPIICDAWNTPGYKDNAFLVKSISVDSFEVTAIEIEGSYICIKPAAGSIPLRLEGKGNRTKISEWPIQ